jgi:localization factor PodJL
MAELQPIAKAKTGWIGWFRRTKAKAQLAPIAPSPRSAASFKPDLADTPRKSIAQHLKTLLIAASVAVIVLVTLQTVLDIFQPEQSQSAQTPPATTAPQQPEPKREAKPGAMLAPVGTPPAVPDVAPATSPPAPATTPADVTGSIGRPVQLPQPAAPSTDRSAPQGVPGSANSALPESFGPTLRSAAAAGNPAAEYEIGARYAEGRGVMQNLPEAVRWFERAAKAGFVPAQFRLAGFYEKGEGTSKNLAMARDLYLAAASKGHAKAMHNLAVLYAEGIDGKPDYKLAAEWFRKAALHGVTDSQFNLAVLYARGVGVSPNLTESYRWFALAANRGDPEAARKRDEIAKRLDQQTLATAKRAVQSFVTEAEPEDAISLKTPPGGWDHGAVALPAAPAPSRTRTTTHP